MKNCKLLLSSAAVLILLCSCASTPAAEPSQKTETHKTHSHSSKSSHSSQETAEEKFLKSLKGITIKSTSTPKEITVGKKFNAPFTFQATAEDGSPLSDFAVTVSYPSSKSDDSITYATTDLTTDENGNISFTADEATFAAKAKVTAYPTPISDDEKLLNSLKDFSGEADWKVRSNLATKGAVLFIWDFNEKDRPANNSSHIQGEFRRHGITMVGNGPVNETSYIGKPQALYKDTYEIIGGSSYGYLIYGTVKFEQPVTALEDESGYYCIFKAQIEAVTMKDGAKVYSSEMTYESKGKNWNECVSKGKEKLAELVVNDIIYGL